MEAEIQELKRQLRLARFSPRRKEMDKLRWENLKLAEQNEKLLKENQLYKSAYESLSLQLNQK